LWVRDIIGILITLAVGLSGQFFVLKPLSILTPKTPLLAPRDWPGSRASSGPEVFSRADIRRWQEKHEFDIRLQRGQYSVLNSGAEIWQRVAWYADPLQTTDAWKRRENEQMGHFANVIPIRIKPLEQDSPGSVLYCHESSQYNTRQCTYFAYYHHWYTEVWFWGGGDQYLSLADVQSLSGRVDQLLLEAPDKP
jgi:hypothetical protein